MNIIVGIFNNTAKAVDTVHESFLENLIERERF